MQRMSLIQSTKKKLKDQPYEIKHKANMASTISGNTSITVLLFFLWQ